MNVETKKLPRKVIRFNSLPLNAFFVMEDDFNDPRGNPPVYRKVSDFEYIFIFGSIGQYLSDNKYYHGLSVQSKSNACNLIDEEDIEEIFVIQVDFDLLVVIKEI